MPYGLPYRAPYGVPYRAAYTGPGIDPLVFHAADTVAGIFNIGVIKGVGGLTEARTGSIYLPDNSSPVEWAEYATTIPGEYYAGGKWWLYGAPAHTTQITQSYNLADAAWAESGTSVAVLDAVGLRGDANGASTLTDNDGAAYEGVGESITVPDDSNVHVWRIFVAKDTDQTRFPEFQCLLTGGTDQLNYVQINTQTGALSERVTTGTVTSQANQFGDWWELLISVANNGTANVTASISIFPARGSTLGTQAVTATGSIIVGNVELHLDTTIAAVRGSSPIFTAGATGSTNATDLSFSDSNHADISGRWFCDFRNAGLNAANNTAMIAVGDAGRFIYTANASQFRSFDGTTVNQGSGVTLAANDVEYKISVAYGDSLKRLRTDSTWNTAGAYDGIWNNGLSKINILKKDGFGTAAVATMLIRDIRRYQLSYDAAQAQAEELSP